MSFTHNINVQWSRGNDQLTARQSVEADGEIPAVSISVPKNSSNLHVVYALDVSQVKLFVLISTGDVTIKTNSSSVPDDTIALKANVPYVWSASHIDAFQLGTDVTGLYITEPNVAACTVEIRGLMDATP